MKKVYLGDAVYVDYDGFHIVLTIEDGISTSTQGPTVRPTNRICLEPNVYRALVEYVAALGPEDAKE